MDDDWKAYAGLILAVGTIFGLDIFFAGSWLWAVRAFNLTVLLGVAWWLRPHLALIPGIFSIPGDLLLLSTSPTSLDFLAWAVFIGLPYVLSTARENQNQTSSREQSKSSDTDRSGPIAPPPATFASEKSQNGDETYRRIQNLIKIHLDRAHKQLGTKTLLLYEVNSSSANLSFAMDPADVVNRDLSFQADHGQGIGWVLRHKETLTQRGRQIDWRNLQYRTRSGELEQVSIVPIHLDNTLVGILVLEWSSEPEADQGWDDLSEQLKHLLALRGEIRELQKNQDVFELLKKLQELNPLEESRFDSMIHRSLEIVREFIPVGDGHAEFFSYTDKHDSSGVIHQGRRALYEEGMQRIRETDELLRVGDLKQHPLGARANKRFSSEELRSFLGGAVRQQGELVGMICLDHPEPHYFTASDAEILRMLLEQLSQVLRIGRERERIKNQVREYRELVKPLQEMNTGGASGVDDVADNLADGLSEVLPTVGIGFYRYRDGVFHRTVYYGAGSPTEQLGADHTLVRRLRNAETRSTLLSFPDLRRFEDYETPLEAEALAVAPVASTERFTGFFTLFVNHAEKLDDVLFEEFDRLLPLLVAPLRLTEQREQFRQRAQREPVSGLTSYAEWKRALAEVVEKGDVKNLITWFIRVPGYEQIAKERGRDRAHNWIESVTTLLEEQLNHSQFTRSYAGTFVGFETGEAEQMDDRLREIMDQLSSWSFPAGSWPAPPESGYKRFSPPLPPVRKLVDAPFSAGESKRKHASTRDE